MWVGFCSMEVAEAFDMIHIGLFHHGQKLSGVSRKRFDIAALTLGIQGVKSQRRFSGAGQAGNDDELSRGMVRSMFSGCGCEPP